MPGFYENLSSQDVVTLDRLARLLLELRESRQTLLDRNGVTDEQALLDRTRAGVLPEHPAYEDYLGAKAIAAATEAIRAELRDYMLQMKPR